MASRTMAGSLGLTGDWDLGEDGWKAGMDDNLLWLSVLTQGRFTDVVTIEPGAPVEGSVYILAAAHATHPNEIAVYDEAAWHYRVAKVGWRLFNTTLGVFQQWSGTTWALDSTGLTAEDVRDIMGAALVSGTNVTITPNDGSDTITVDAAGGSTDEQIQDMISTFLLQGTNVTLTYNDAGNHLTIAAGASTTFASAAEIRTGTEAAKAIAPDQLALAHVPQTLVDGANISWDMAAGFNAEVTLGGNRTLDTPTNRKRGLTYVLEVTQDGTGNRTMTWPASFNWGSVGAPTLSTGAGKTDVITLYCRDAVTPKFRAVFNKDA
jgi:hypothetical protein